MSVVEVRQAAKTYLMGQIKVTALKGVDLTVEGGEFMALAGPSGSGKTTLLNLIGGFEKPTSGSVRVKGTDLAATSADALASLRARQMGFVFQNFNLLPVLTALENVEYPLLLSDKFSASRHRDLARQALERVGLSGHLLHRPMEMSGGQRQRVAIARAIVVEPDIILADEPTANLDHTTGEEILRLMKDINRVSKTTFIFSTHDQKIMDMADRVVRLLDGAFVEGA
ncbi:MAG: ABC transporter ATP-binding protein [Candidatus Omnitrophica bacterium]|nr:ABC transporter ATP-binding protein [Candidatus Omnitrophota bacterium]